MKNIAIRPVVHGITLQPLVQVVLVADDGTETDITEWTAEQAAEQAIAILDTIEESRANALLVRWWTRRRKVDVE